MKKMILVLSFLTASSAFAGKYERDIGIAMDCGIVSGLTVGAAVVSATAQVATYSDDVAILKRTWEVRRDAGSMMAEVLSRPKKLGTFTNERIGDLLNLFGASYFASYSVPSAQTALEWKNELLKQALSFREGMKSMQDLVNGACKSPR